MRGEGFRIHGWDDLVKVVLTIVIVLIIVSMLVDFMSWREAINIIKREMPTSGFTGGKWLQGFGYVPFAWRGSLNAILFLRGTEDNLTTDGEVWCKLENTKFIVQLKDGWGEYHITRTTIQDPHDPNYGQPDYRFQDFTIFVKVLDKGEKVYVDKYVGQKEVDYPITKEIVEKNKWTLENDTQMPLTSDIEDWLCSFTKFSLHQYVVGIFERGEMIKGKDWFPYYLDNLLGPKFENVYITEWNKTFKNVQLLVVYETEKEVYPLIWKTTAGYVGCGGGTWVFHLGKY